MIAASASAEFDFLSAQHLDLPNVWLAMWYVSLQSCQSLYVYIYITVDLFGGKVSEDGQSTTNDASSDSIDQVC
jgi:hypothetical protein